MAESIEALEQRIEALRVAVRKAAAAGDRLRARALRTDLRRAEHAWDDALAELEDQADSERPERPRATPGPPVSAPRSPQPGRLLPMREQVHHALTLLTVPAAPRLVVAVHEAFFTGEIVAARLTSLRRDEERSFRASPFARPYYLCTALTADRLSPARGLLAVSTWAMADRIVGPLTPRVHFLTAATRIAEHVGRIAAPQAAATRLLWRFAANIPGTSDGSGNPDPAQLSRAAQEELHLHVGPDREHREKAATRALSQLDEAERLFGSRARSRGDHG